MKHCRKCGVELVVGKTWHPSAAKYGDYICADCKRAYVRQWKKDNPDYQRQWHAAHREERISYCRQWHEENADHERRWRKNNRERIRETFRRYYARKKGVTIKPVDEVAIYKLYNNACIYCGATDNLELDHIVALSVGGKHCEDNLVVACRSCNASKNDGPLVQWLQTQPYSTAWLV